MKSAEMKLKKFEMLIRDIDEYLGKSGIFKDVYIEKDENTSGNNSQKNEDKRKFSPVNFYEDINEDKILFSPIELFIESNTKSEYLNIILKNSFRTSCCCGKCDFQLSNYVKQDVNLFIEEIRKCNKCYNLLGTFNNKCSVPNHLMFWLIFIVSVDNENYNENLSIVSDVAYLLGFDEERLADWVVAVKGVLEGKKLNEIEYKTEAAKEFFIR